MLSRRHLLLLLTILFGSALASADENRVDDAPAIVEAAPPPAASPSAPGQSLLQILHSQFLTQQLQGSSKEALAQRGLLWRTDDGRPALEYRLDNNSVIRVRPIRNGARIMMGWEF